MRPQFILCQAGRPAVTVVYGSERAAAERVATLLSGAVAEAAAIVRDSEVLERDTLQLREPWLGRNLVLVGDIYSNRVVLMLACRRMVAANSVSPGPRRYELRTLFAPLCRGADILVVGAGDKEGLATAEQRLSEMVESDGPTRFLPPILESGPGKPPNARSLSGGFDRQAFAAYWEANPKALDKAHELLISELKRSPDQGLWGFRAAGHYSWECHYLGLSQLAATGLLASDLLREVNGRLVDLALRNTDWTAVAALEPQSPPDAYTRHQFSGLASQFLLHEYLHRRAELPSEVTAADREMLGTNLGVLRGKLLELAADHRYRMESSEGFSCMETLSNLSAMYLHLGLLEQMAEAGIFRHQTSYAVAMRDNLNSDPGTNAYIACRPGAQFTNTVGGAGIVAGAFADRNPQTTWLYRHHKLAFTYLGVTMPPGMLAPPTDGAEAPPGRHTGVELVPHDPWFYEHYVKPETHPFMVEGETVEPYEGPAERAFSKAVFRDGFERDDGYLLMQGENIGPSFQGAGPQGNAICRYTELGSLLLYQNVQKVTGWARSVVSVSRGQQDPMSAACSAEAFFKTDDLQGLSSRMADCGGAEWGRHVVRRRHAYFAVIDEVRFGETAPAGDDFQLVCRWRSYHAGEMVDERRFIALDGSNGTELHIVNADQSVCDVTLEPRDGASRPTILRHYQSGRFRQGEQACFRSVLHASNDAHRRTFDARPLGRTGLLVHGVTEGMDVTDLIAIGPENAAGLPESDAALRVLSADRCVWAGCTRLRIGDISIHANQPVTVVVAAEQHASLIITDGAGTTLRGHGGLSVNGRALAGSGQLLAPGHHALEVTSSRHLLSTVGARIMELLGESAIGMGRPPVSGGSEAAPARPVDMRVAGRIEPPYALHRTIRPSVSPALLDGHPYSWARNPEQWFDRGVPWNGAEVPGWKSGRGEIMLDFTRPIAVRALRFVWPGWYQCDRFNPKPLEPGEVDIRVEGVGSGTERALASTPGAPARPENYYVENAHYMYTALFPALSVPVDLPAQQRLRITVQPRAGGRQSRVLFSEIEVITGDRERRAELQLRASPSPPAEGVDLVSWSPTRLLMLDSRELRTVAEHELTAPVVDAKFADIDGDGVAELLVYTLDDRFTAYEATGLERFRVDMTHPGGDVRSWLSDTRPACFAAWRPDANGNCEYVFFPHYSMVRLSPEPELEISRPEQGHTWGAKATLTVPDMDGDDREELLAIGLYARGHRILGSASALEKGECNVLGHQAFTGYSSGNMELALYFDGHLIRNDGSSALVVALTPGGIDCLSYPEFEPVWRHFNHPPNQSSVVWQTDDGEAAVVVGRGDGFVVRYRVSDGVHLGTFRVGRDVRAVAVVHDLLAAGGPDGFVLLNLQFREVGRYTDAVDTLCAVGGHLAVGYSSGAIGIVKFGK